MNFMRFMRSEALRVASPPCKPFINGYTKRFRKPSICNLCLTPRDYTPCFDLKRVSWERGSARDAAAIRAFMYTHYWPREPSIMALWMNLRCSYLAVLTDKYCTSGDRFLALEQMDRTCEKKLVGVLVANMVFPWMIKELEEWALCTYSKPERDRLYFTAHCLKQPNLFKKYNVNYIYNVEVLGSAAEATGQGVATRLLREALLRALELRHPLVQVVSLGEYTNKICERCGMTREWSMKYTDYVDDVGQIVFYPRRPHRTVTVYTKSFPLSQGITLPCKPPF